MIEQCRLCAGTDLRLWMADGHHGDLLYYKCGNCSLWNYDLDCGLNQEQYTETYVSPTDSSAPRNQEVLQSWRFLHRQVPSPGTIMDIGCGTGALLYYAREQGWDVHGMELTQKAAADIQADLGIDVVVANFLDYDNPDAKKYDVVVLRHVLEHLPDPLAAMRSIHGLLKDYGLALLEFPNTRSFSYGIKRLLKNRGLRNRKYAPEWRPGHCNEYCRESFEYLLEQTGFELEIWRSYSHKPLANALSRLLPVASKARALVRKRPGG